MLVLRNVCVEQILVLALGLSASSARSVLIVIFHEDAPLLLERPDGRHPAALAAPQTVVFAVEDTLVVVVVAEHTVDKVLL